MQTVRKVIVMSPSVTAAIPTVAVTSCEDNVANETVMSMESGFWGYPPSMDSGGKGGRIGKMGRDHKRSVFGWI